MAPMYWLVHVGSYNYQMQESGLTAEFMKEEIMNKLLQIGGGTAQLVNFSIFTMIQKQEVMSHVA